MRPNPNPVKSFLSACSLALLLLATPDASAAEAEAKAAAPAAPADVAASILKLTGAQTRIVWLRHKQWETHKGGLDGGAGYALMALDTGGKGERELVPEGELYNPLITPSGRRVVYTANTDGKLQIHCVDWDGANSRKLGEGLGLWTWRDPATGIEWVYVGDSFYDSTFIDRFQLDKPETRERVYTGRLAQHFSLSADGTRAVDEFPWPNAGMLYTRTGQVDFKNYRTGCNSYISPDNSYLVTIMSGGHDLVTLYKPDGSSRDVRLIPPGLKPLKRGGNGCVWNPKWASDARHMVVAGPFKQLGPDHADIWLGQFADDFNSIAKWVQVTNNDYMDVYAYVWVDPELGQYAGEAPYTLAVSPAVIGQGAWAWDYGDGAKGTEGKHTYGKAGAYAIMARQGDRVLRGRVTVKPRTKPRAMVVQLFDDEHVQVQFDKCISIDKAVLSFKSGVAIGSAALDGVGLRLNLTLAGKLPEADTLRVQDIRDLAQEPNILTEDLKIVRPGWPAVRSNLVFLWEGNHKQSFNWNPQSRAFQDNTFNHWGQARFDRHGVMVLDGGTYTVTDGGSGIYSQCGKTGKLTVESVITPFNLYQGSASQPAVAFGFGRPGDSNFSLVQEGNHLLLLIRMRHENRNEVRRVELCTLEQDRPHHVLVSVADNAVTCYLNGAVATQAELKGTFAWNAPDWSQGLYMGGVPGNPYPWCGKLEGIAVYSIVLDAAQAARNHAVYAKTLAARPVAKQIQLRAKLAAKSRIPAAAEIAPYRDTLVVNEYEVVRVTQGPYAAPKFRVVQWGLLDTKATWLAGAEVGQEFDLTLEAFGDHPQLENEMRIDTLKEDFGLDLFVDVTHR
ncbi:MAG TPA: LamG-like jellyroll fold domain-containing protein, partial [Phycisphaerae bacterium]|nr:LamG-like jellyroll fold domain-containing protein [Phycisphaerae bacterium]